MNNRYVLFIPIFLVLGLFFIISSTGPTIVDAPIGYDYADSNSLNVNGTITRIADINTRYGKGIAAPSVNDYLYTDSANLKITGNLTIFEDFTPTNVASSDFQDLIIQGDRDCCTPPFANPSNILYRLQLKQNGSILYVHQADRNGVCGSAMLQLVTHGGLISNNNNYRISFTRNIQTRRVELRINGVHQDLFFLSGAPYAGVLNGWNTVACGPFDGSSAQFRLTNTKNIQQYPHDFDHMIGNIYEVRVWNKLENTTTLDNLANPNSGISKYQNVGDETAAYYFEETKISAVHQVTSEFSQIGFAVIPAIIGVGFAVYMFDKASGGDEE